MQYWLFKSEPSTWSWQDQMKKGDVGEPWNGVRNHLAKQNMLAMKVGDLGFFYHSVLEKQIVGIVEVIKEAYPDTTDETGKFFMVDVKAVKPLAKPVTLQQCKEKPELQDMALNKCSRLSVQPVTLEQWLCVLSMAEKQS